MAYNFAADSGKLNDVYNTIKGYRDELSECVESIFGIVGEGGALNDSWSGNTYKEFTAACEKYRPFLNEMIAIIDDFLSNTKTQSSQASDLEERIASACRNASK